MGDTEKVGMTYGDSMNFTYKVRGADEHKIAESVGELLEGREMKSLVGRKISIYSNKSRVGEINVDALMWAVMKNQVLTH